jgi:transposase InsO family protein
VGIPSAHLLRDQGAVYGRDVQARAEALGVETVRPPVRSPRANAIAARAIGTPRREGLDHLIPLDERHLRTVLAEFVDSYHTERPHRTLRLETHRSATRSPTSAGAVTGRPVLGGLHHTYARAT